MKYKVVFAVVLAALLFLGGYVLGSYTSRSKDISISSPSSERILDELKDSVIYDKETGQLQFTIPEEILSDSKYSIFVSGRIKIGENGMSWHAFEEESANYSWEAGKTYMTEVPSEDLDFILIYAALVDNDGSVLNEGWNTTISSDGTITEDATLNY